MSQHKLLKKVAEALERAGIAYMLTGSMASSLQGAPRATHDIDLVVQIEADSVQTLVAAFPPPNFYLDAETAVAAIRQGGMFNLLDLVDGDQVDFWMLTDTPFDQSRFSRRLEFEVRGIRLKASRPEDTILMKLRWAQMSGGSKKQFADALAVYEVQFSGLDMGYLTRWAARLGITSEWERLKNEAHVVR